MIQAGDPTAGGSGGPGYSTRDVPLGKVVEGQSVVDAIGMLGDPAGGGTGTPLQPVVIETTKLVKA